LGGVVVSSACRITVVAVIVNAAATARRSHPSGLCGCRPRPQV